MKHIKREVKLGITAVTAVIILIWGINFLKAQALFDKNNVFYGIYDKVDGLKVSSSVIYRGYSVGQVNDIRFVGAHYDKVLVQFSVGKNLQIPSNTIASIQNADLMGGKAIQLLPGDSEVYAENGDTLRSELSVGLLEQLAEQAGPLKEKTGRIMASLDTVLFSLAELFDANNEGNIRTSLESVGRTLAYLERTSATLNQLIDKESVQISAILSDLHKVAGNVESISDSLKAVQPANVLLGLRSVLTQTDSIVAKINHGTGTLGSVVNNNELYDNLALVSENLNRLLVEFRQNPKRFVNFSVFDFGGNKKQGENEYGIVVAESKTSLPLNAELYVKYPDLKEIRKNGTYLYIVYANTNLTQVKKELEGVKQVFGEAYIVKLD